MIEIKDSLLWDCEIADCGIKKSRPSAAINSMSIC